MPRQQTYGKRSRALYDPRAAFSSPEQTSNSKPLPIKPCNDESKVKKPDLEAVAVTRKPRIALGEKAVNSVVAPVVFPVAILEIEVDIPKEPKPRRRRRTPKLERRPKAPSLVYIGCADGQEDLVPRVTDHPSTPIRSKGSPRLSQVAGSDDRPGRDVSAQPREITPRLRITRDTRSTPLAVRPEIVSTFEESGPADPYEEHCRPLLDLAVHSITDFATWSEEIADHFAVTKIAEASFGEVYRFSLLDNLPDFSSTEESVFKVIPLQQPQATLPSDKRKRDAALKNAESMSKPFDVANEVKLLQRMSTIPGFTNFRDVRILQGRPAGPFLQAFKSFNAAQKAKKKELSHFPDPSKKSSYSPDQLWAVIEMQDAGTDLERLVEQGQCASIWTVWDVFWQVVLSLAKGEEGAEFEHRDLHLGNICVHHLTPTPEREIDIKRKLGFTALETTIIDYTISRCAMPDTSIAYHDLALDAGIFEGDSTDEYQYDIYRYMRSLLYFSAGYTDYHAHAAEGANSGRSWEQYHPQTNLVWLHFVLYKLLEQLAWPSAKKAPAKKAAKAEHARWKRASDLEHILLRVQDLLDPGAICANGVRSASHLVGVAVEEGWIDVEDIVGVGDDEAGSEQDLVLGMEGLELGR